jgi:hypothetical protein
MPIRFLSDQNPQIEYIYLDFILHTFLKCQLIEMEIMQCLP